MEVATEKAQLIPSTNAFAGVGKHMQPGSNVHGGWEVVAGNYTMGTTADSTCVPGIAAEHRTISMTKRTALGASGIRITFKVCLGCIRHHQLCPLTPLLACASVPFFPTKGDRCSGG